MNENQPSATGGDLDLSLLWYEDFAQRPGDLWIRTNIHKDKGNVYNF